LVIEQNDSDKLNLTLRWRWSLLVGSVVAGAVLLLSLFILDLERDAWQKSQDRQSILLTNQLSSQLRLPMFSGSQQEVDLLIKSFFETVTHATTISLNWKGAGDLHFGDSKSPPSLSKVLLSPIEAIRVDSGMLWYAKTINYGQVELGELSVCFSEASWHEIASEIKKRLAIAAALVIIIAGIIVYWIAGRMSRPIEMLAEAEQHVANGNFDVRLPVKGRDEISTAMKQFNRMVEQLAHKEKVRDAFGRYLNPELIARLFADNASVPGSHSQDVTVLFVDMVDFTSYSQSTRAEAVVDVINEYFELFHHIIDAFGGHVDKYIGDAVMAVFNHPFEDKEHVSHAVLAGLAIIEACNELSIRRPNGEPIRFRVGIDRGEVIVGNIGARKRLEYTVIGNTVNVASRMAGLGMGVVASETIFNELEFGFKMESMGEQSIKGIEHPIQCGHIIAESRKVRARVDEVVSSAFKAKEKSGSSDGYFDIY